MDSNSTYNIFDIIESTDEKQSDNKTKYCNYIYDHSDLIKINWGIKDNIKRLQLEINNKLPFIEQFVDFEFYYIETIFHFILETFNKIRYKFYINWINTFPITLETYKDSLLYKNSWQYNEDEDKIFISRLLLNFPRYTKENDNLFNNK